jgi:hypothetical protein
MYSKIRIFTPNIVYEMYSVIIFVLRYILYLPKVVQSDTVQYMYSQRLCVGSVSYHCMLGDKYCGVLGHMHSIECEYQMYKIARDVFCTDVLYFQ